MKWTLKLERIDEAGILQSSVVGFIERPELTSEADLGLTHEDGKYVIRQVQAEIAHDQVRALVSKTRPCSCGRCQDPSWLENIEKWARIAIKSENIGSHILRFDGFRSSTKLGPDLGKVAESNSRIKRFRQAILSN